MSNYPKGFRQNASCEICTHCISYPNMVSMLICGLTETREEVSEVGITNICDEFFSMKDSVDNRSVLDVSVDIIAKLQTDKNQEPDDFTFEYENVQYFVEMTASSWKDPVPILNANKLI